MGDCQEALRAQWAVAALQLQQAAAIHEPERFFWPPQGCQKRMAATGYEEIVLMDNVKMPWKPSGENRIVAPRAGEDSGAEKLIGAGLVMFEIVAGNAVDTDELPARRTAADCNVRRFAMLLEFSKLYFPGALWAGDKPFAGTLRFAGRW